MFTPVPFMSIQTPLDQKRQNAKCQQFTSQNQWNWNGKYHDHDKHVYSLREKNNDVTVKSSREGSPVFSGYLTSPSTIVMTFWSNKSPISVSGIFDGNIIAWSNGTNWEKIPCQYFAKGRCIKSHACPFAHIEIENKCSFFITGYCASGNECRFAHNNIRDRTLTISSPEIQKEQVIDRKLENHEYIVYIKNPPKLSDVKDLKRFLSTASLKEARQFECRVVDNVICFSYRTKNARSHAKKILRAYYHGHANCYVDVHSRPNVQYLNAIKKEIEMTGSVRFGKISELSTCLDLNTPQYILDIPRSLSCLADLKKIYTTFSSLLYKAMIKKNIWSERQVIKNIWSKEQLIKLKSWLDLCEKIIHNMDFSLNGADKKGICSSNISQNEQEKIRYDFENGLKSSDKELKYSKMGTILWVDNVPKWDHIDLATLCTWLNKSAPWSKYGISDYDISAAGTFWFELGNKKNYNTIASMIKYYYSQQGHEVDVHMRPTFKEIQMLRHEVNSCGSCAFDMIKLFAERLDLCSPDHLAQFISHHNDLRKIQKIYKAFKNIIELALVKFNQRPLQIEKKLKFDLLQYLSTIKDIFGFSHTDTIPLSYTKSVSSKLTNIPHKSMRTSLKFSDSCYPSIVPNPNYPLIAPNLTKSFKTNLSIRKSVPSSKNFSSQNKYLNSSFNGTYVNNSMNFKDRITNRLGNNNRTPTIHSKDITHPLKHGGVSIIANDDSSDQDSPPSYNSEQFYSSDSEKMFKKSLNTSQSAIKPVFSSKFITRKKNHFVNNVPTKINSMSTIHHSEAISDSVSSDLDHPSHPCSPNSSCLPPSDLPSHFCSSDDTFSSVNSFSHPHSSSSPPYDVSKKLQSANIFESINRGKDMKIADKPYFFTQRYNTKEKLLPNMMSHQSTKTHAKLEQAKQWNTEIKTVLESKINVQVQQNKSAREYDQVIQKEVKCMNNGKEYFQKIDAKPQSVSELLISIGLSKYVPLFQRSFIDMEAIFLLSDTHMKEMGLPLGPRVKLLEKISSLVG